MEYVLLSEGRDSTEQHGRYKLLVVTETGESNADSDYEISKYDYGYVELPYNAYYHKDEFVKYFFKRFGRQENTLAIQDGVYGVKSVERDVFVPFTNQSRFAERLGEFLKSEYLL